MDDEDDEVRHYLITIKDNAVSFPINNEIREDWSRWNDLDTPDLLNAMMTQGLTFLQYIMGVEMYQGLDNEDLQDLKNQLRNIYALEIRDCYWDVVIGGRKD